MAKRSSDGRDQTSPAREVPKGSLQIRAQRAGRSTKPAGATWTGPTDGRLGPAWAEQDGEGRRVPRSGRPPAGKLDERRAYRLMDRGEAVDPPELRPPPRRAER
jgi:hypothetical protein